MKKLLLFITLFIGVIYFAQTETQTIFKLTDIISKSGDPVKSDSAIVEMKKIIDNSNDPVTKSMGPQLLAAATELRNMKKTVVPTKDLDVLDKNDLKGFRIEKDDFKKSTFIYRKGWGFDDRFSPYIALVNGNANLRWKLKYRASSWLFIDKIFFIIDGEDFSVKVDPDRNVISGNGISEDSDIFADENVINILRKIAASKEEVKVRYDGKYSADTKIPLSTCEKIADVVKLYDKLKK